jgi:hypothetical protein
MGRKIDFLPKNLSPNAVRMTQPDSGLDAEQDEEKY